jgi:hypothetical protein
MRLGGGIPAQAQRINERNQIDRGIIRGNVEIRHQALTDDDTGGIGRFDHRFFLPVDLK